MIDRTLFLEHAAHPTHAGGKDSGRLLLVKLGPKNQRTKQLKENDVLLAVFGMPVLTAPLEMVVDMFATGKEVVADFARNVQRLSLACVFVTLTSSRDTVGLLSAAGIRVSQLH